MSKQSYISYSVNRKRSVPPQPTYVAMQDEGTALASGQAINFVGAGVVAVSAVGVTTVTIPGGSVSAAGWTDLGPVIQLTTGTDQVTVGTSATTGRKFTVTETGANQGIRIEASGGTSIALDARVGAEVAARFTVLADGSIRWSDGTNPADVLIARSAAAELTLSNAAGGGLTLIPPADNAGILGSDARRFNRVRAVSVVSGDLGFDDLACPLCQRGFSVGETLALRVVRIERGMRGAITQTVPCHATCPL